MGASVVRPPRAEGHCSGIPAAAPLTDPEARCKGRMESEGGTLPRGPHAGVPPSPVRAFAFSAHWSRSCSDAGACEAPYWHPLTWYPPSAGRWPAGHGTQQKAPAGFPSGLQSGDPSVPTQDREPRMHAPPAATHSAGPFEALQPTSKVARARIPSPALKHLSIMCSFSQAPRPEQGSDGESFRAAIVGCCPSPSCISEGRNVDLAGNSRPTLADARRR